MKPPFPIKPPHRPVEDDSVLVKIMKVVVLLMHMAIVWSMPLWGGVSWAVMILLGWVEDGFESLGWEEAREEAGRVKRCWEVGGHLDVAEGKKKR